MLSQYRAICKIEQAWFQSVNVFEISHILNRERTPILSYVNKHVKSVEETASGYFYTKKSLQDQKTVGPGPASSELLILTEISVQVCEKVLIIGDGLALPPPFCPSQNLPSIGLERPNMVSPLRLRNRLRTLYPRGSFKPPETNIFIRKYRR